MKHLLVIPFAMLLFILSGCGDAQEPPKEVVASENKVIEFKNEKLEAMIRENLNKPEGQITEADLATIEFVHFIRLSDQDLTIVAKMSNLTKARLMGGTISSVARLKGLKKLTDLNLAKNQIEDLSSVVELRSLTKLAISENKIVDVSALEKLPHLTHLWVGGNDITDITPLAKLTNLTQLGLSGNDISDFSPLKGLTNLMDLHTGHPVITKEQKSMLWEALPKLEIDNSSRPKTKP